MTRGLLTDPDCTGTNEELNDVQSQNDDDAFSWDEHKALVRAMWQVRDLERLKSRDSDEVTTWH